MESYGQYRIAVYLYGEAEFSYIVDAKDEYEAEQFGYEDYPEAFRVYVEEI